MDLNRLLWEGLIMLTYDILAVTDEMVEKEDIREVTSSKIFSREGEPDENGLASYEIFGYPGSEERKKRFGFIKLHDIFVNPHCIFELKSIKRIFIDLIYGYGEFYIKDGELFKVEDTPPEGVKIGTGAKFLYDNWNKLNFDYSDLKPGLRYNRLRFLKMMKKSQIFTDKILVVPPFYRDVDVRRGGKKNEFNSIYIKIINLAQSMESTRGMFGSLGGGDISESYRQITDTLIEFHEKVIKMYGGRKGFIHKYIMGKSVDFSARLVISCLDLSKIETPESMPANFEKSVIPLFAAIKCFAPFVVNGVREIITDYLKGSEYVYSVKGRNLTEKHASKLKNKNEYKRIRLANDWQTILTSSYIYNLIELYHDSPEHRLDPFTLPTEDGDEIEVVYYEDDGTDIDLEADIATAASKLKTLRLIHLFYMAAVDKIIDKYVYITRYPIEDHNSTYPSGIEIIPYKRTGKVTVGDTEYKYFPIVNYEKDIKVISSMFTDSLVIFPGYLSALDGDFDGDMINVIGIFTKEANNDARNHIKSVGNMCAIDGSTTRELGVLATQTIFGLTY